VSGVLVDGHNPRDWALVLCDLLLDSQRREELSHGAVAHAADFGWDATADATIAVYEHALRDRAATTSGARSSAR
jgi:D-inositol-3-phosphate glycosyltransferase